MALLPLACSRVNGAYEDTAATSDRPVGSSTSAGVPTTATTDPPVATRAGSGTTGASLTATQGSDSTGQPIECAGVRALRIAANPQMQRARPVQRSGQTELVHRAPNGELLAVAVDLDGPYDSQPLGIIADTDWLVTSDGQNLAVVSDVPVPTVWIHDGGGPPLPMNNLTITTFPYRGFSWQGSELRLTPIGSPTRNTAELMTIDVSTLVPSTLPLETAVDWASSAFVGNTGVMVVENNLPETNCRTAPIPPRGGAGNPTVFQGVTCSAPTVDWRPGDHAVVGFHEGVALGSSIAWIVLLGGDAQLLSPWPLPPDQGIQHGVGNTREAFVDVMALDADRYWVVWDSGANQRADLYRVEFRGPDPVALSAQRSIAFARPASEFKQTFVLDGHPAVVFANQAPDYEDGPGLYVVVDCSIDA